MKSSRTTSKPERKTVERNRRIHMKGLCFKLTSLIPPHHLKEAFSQQDQLEQAAVYIKELQEKVERLKARTDASMSTSLVGFNRPIRSGMMLGLMLPLVKLRELGNSLEVVLVCGVTRSFLFSNVISVLDEEGVEVIAASFSVSGDKQFHVIHSKVVCARVGFDAARVYRRLKELVD